LHQSLLDGRPLIIKLRRNSGQISGLAARFDHASCEYILAMDGDPQLDPNDIPAFLEKIDEGYGRGCPVGKARRAC
jgi:glycosyltransferase involved in cell wall biosynthesis